MDVRFLGGASEVGRLGMVLRHDGGTLLFDYGVKPEDPPQFPLEAPPVDGLLLTHSHLDHCGMVPAVSSRHDTDVYTTSVTADVVNILLEDSLKVSQQEGFPEPFSVADIRAMNRNLITVSHGDRLAVGGTEVAVHPAGHIPGSSMFDVAEGRTLLFTGDIQTFDTHLMAGALPVPCDVLVLESTYAGRSHPPRKETEGAFLERVEEVVGGGGLAVVPCFAVARTQEVLMTLADSGFEVWVDGMGRRVSDAYLRHPRSLRSAREFRRALRRSRMVRSARTRSAALRGDVVVTTGGMLDGGPVLFYLSRVKDDPQSAVLLTGYQVEGTNGRRLLEQGVLEIYGALTDVHCQVDRFDFSAHAGHEELVAFVDGCDPETVVLMHGDARHHLAEVLEGRECLLPQEGEWYAL